MNIFCRTIVVFFLFAAVGCTALTIGPASAQLRTIKLDDPRDAGGPDALTQPVLTEQLVQSFDERLTSVREHHRPIPLNEAFRPFAAELKQPKSVIRSKRARFDEGVTLKHLRSVTGTAKLNYNYASPISEPSVASADSEVLVTGNWYAARSLDGGNEFEFVDPEKMFGSDSFGNGFCCDQLVIYDRKRDLFIWYLQGSRGSDGNLAKILVTDSGKFQKNSWKAYSIKSTDLVGANKVWLDYPDLALSKKYLYVSSNIFSTGPSPSYIGATVFRISLDELSGSASPNIDVWNAPSQIGSLRFVQALDQETMYWAAHANTAEIGVFSWGDNDNAPSGVHRAFVERWSRPNRDNIKTADGPGGHPWLDRLDSRITAGWVTPKHIGFAWGVGGDGLINLPHVRVAILDRSKVDVAGEPFVPITPVAEPHLWTDILGLAYPAASVNMDGEVGVSVAFGGPTHYPGHAVGRLVVSERDDAAGNDFSWSLKVTREGRDGPRRRDSNTGNLEPAGVWGDYFSVRQHGSRPNNWIAVGYTIQSTKGESLKAESEYIEFVPTVKITRATQ